MNFFRGRNFFLSPKFFANDISSREIVRKIRNLAEKLENQGTALKIIYFNPRTTGLLPFGNQTRNC